MTILVHICEVKRIDFRKWAQSISAGVVSFACCTKSSKGCMFVSSSGYAYVCGRKCTCHLCILSMAGIGLLLSGTNHMPLAISLQNSLRMEYFLSQHAVAKPSILTHYLSLVGSRTKTSNSLYCSSAQVHVGLENETS
jgi:hypothetical protein